MNTKLFSVGMVVALASSTSALRAGPFEPKEVVAEAKWVAHLDVDAFKTTHLGNWAVAEFLDPKLAPMVENLRRDLNIDLDWHKIRSITAFGSDLTSHPEASAVIVIRSDLDIKGGLQAVADHIAAAGAPQDKSLRRISTERKEVETYSLAENGCAAVLPGNTLVISRTQAAVDRAVDTFLGRHPHLSSTGKLKDMSSANGEILSVCLTEPVELPKDLPPPAAGLKNVRAIRLALVEDGDKVGARLMLKTPSAEAAVQLQQVLQGLVSVLALTQPEDPLLKDLSQTARTSVNGEVATLSVQAPMDRLGPEIKTLLAGGGKGAKPTKKHKKHDKAEDPEKPAAAPAPNSDPGKN